jgi:hypothetical protein
LELAGAGDAAMGSYLSNKLGGLTIGGLGSSDLGVDVLDVADNAARISITEAEDLITAGLSFAENDTGITLELAGDGVGSYLGNKLGGLTIGGLGANGLGVDVLDVADNTARISITEAEDLITAGLNFAANDDGITLELAGAGDAAMGSYLSNKLGGLTIGGLGSSDLGVDVLDVADNQLNITMADFGDLIDAGISLTANDVVTLDATDLTDGLGTYLGNLDEGKGLTLAQLKTLGVDHIDVLQDTLTEALNNDIDFDWNGFADADLTLKPTLSVQLANSTPDAISVDSLVVDVVDGLIAAGVEMAGDLSLGDLLDTLTDTFGAAATDGLDAADIDLSALQQSGVSGFEATAMADVVITDELARALADAGMLSAVPDAQIAIEGGNSTYLQTPLKLLAELGVDQIQTTQAKVFMDVGTADMGELLQSLLTLVAGHEHDGVVDSLFGSGSNTQAGLVLDGTSANASDLLTALADAMDGGGLDSLGFTEINFIVDVGGDLPGVSAYDGLDYVQASQDTKVALLGESSADKDVYTFTKSVG